MYAAEDGLHFDNAARFTHSQLNEDGGVEDAVDSNYNDEIYVGARFLNASGETVALAESNQLIGDF